MAVLKPFTGIRPVPGKAATIASKPYDVLNEKEARLECEGNPLSFYHVIKPEIEFPDDHDHYAPEIYSRGSDNFKKLIDQGIFFTDDQPYYYIYRQTMHGRMQYGIVGCASVEDYFNNVIRKHELTRPDKEEDRKNHVRVSNLNYEPVFFAYPQNTTLDAAVAKAVRAPAEFDFVSDDGIGHTFWVVRDQELIRKIESEFKNIPYIYVADGHHRTAAAALVGRERKSANAAHTGNEPYNFFLAVLFPDNQLQIMDYNRVVKDLNGLTPGQFIEKLRNRFEVGTPQQEPVRPGALHEFGMYLEGAWYRLVAKPGTFNDQDPIGVLDVTILSEGILEPVLGITDLRTDKRIEFIGGLRGLGELKKRVDSGEMAVAFALYPVTMKQLIDIADTGNIMPPKTTWFEPKLRSGLILHSIR